MTPKTGPFISLTFFLGKGGEGRVHIEAMVLFLGSMGSPEFWLRWGHAVTVSLYLGSVGSFGSLGYGGCACWGSGGIPGDPSVTGVGGSYLL